MHVIDVLAGIFAWEQRKFADVFDCSIPNNTLPRTELNYEDGEVKNIHYGDILVKFDSCVDVKHEKIPFITSGYADDYKSRLLQDGDIVFADTAEDETTGKAIEITNTQGSNIVAGLHTIAYRPRTKMPPCFSGYYFNSHSYRKQLFPLMQGVKVLSLSKTNLSKTETITPVSFYEQAAIGKFFRTLDDTITLYKRKLDGLRELKKGYLQNMFPLAGECVPRVRFAEFSESWQERKLGEMFAERSERSAYGELISVTINSGVVKASTLERKDNSSEDKSNYKRVEVGDIAYNSMRMWQGASGVSCYSGILSPAYTVIVPNSGISSLFFSYMFKNAKMIQIFQSCSQGLTSDTWSLKFPLLKNISVTKPCYREQKKIGEFFSALDNQITAHTAKLKQLRQLKAAYLQRMLV